MSSEVVVTKSSPVRISMECKINTGNLQWETFTVIRESRLQTQKWQGDAFIGPPIVLIPGSDVELRFCTVKLLQLWDRRATFGFNRRQEAGLQWKRWDLLSGLLCGSRVAWSMLPKDFGHLAVYWSTDSRPYWSTCFSASFTRRSFGCRRGCCCFSSLCFSLCSACRMPQGCCSRIDEPRQYTSP